jgi:hypothetical protein
MMKTIAAIIIFLLLLCGLYIGISVFRCQELKSPPEVPVYPGSILVKEGSFGTDAFPVHEYHYESTTSPEEIVEFYKSNEEVIEFYTTSIKRYCRPTLGSDVKQVCTGSAKPFGSYEAVINLESTEAEPLTTYYITVRWEGCGNFD